MARITREGVFPTRTHAQTHRKCFGEHSGLQLDKKPPRKPTFSVSFYESVGPIYEKMTGFSLRKSQEHGNYWHFLDNEEQINRVKEWEKSVKNLIFLRDCLDLSIALSFNFTDNKSGVRTELGELESRAKHEQDSAAIQEIGERLAETVQSLPFYSTADFLCAVPPAPEKSFDLPSRLAEYVSDLLPIQNITGLFSFLDKKDSIKTKQVTEKWDAWEQSGLTFSAPKRITDKSVIIIDDKYQSGITIQYVAKSLLEAGAAKVYGLCVVKTLRDTDNT